MNWIILSFLMFFSSIVYYLFTRYSQILLIDRKVNFIANFSIPSILYLFLAVNRGVSLNPGIGVILASFLVALFLNYIGSVAAFRGMEHAPNAGYSVVIQKSYALYTSIAAIFLFNAPLPVYKYVIILCIIFFLAIVSKTKNRTSLKYHGYYWVVLSLVSFFCYGTSSLVAKFIISSGTPIVTYLFWNIFFTTIISLVDYAWHHKQIVFVLNKKNIFVLLAIGLSVSFFYYFKQVAEIAAPNVGYVNAINASSNAVLILLIAMIFKESISKMKFIAVLGVIVGIVVLII